MKKNYFLLALLTLPIASFAQKTILVNGGQFGNQSENVNLVIYDTQTRTSQVIDTIQTQSVQDIIIEGNTAFVAAQDSIVKYDLDQGVRLAAAAFNGVSTKTFAISGSELLVGNWYAQTSDNIYIYDKSNLTLLDSITEVEKGATSILVDNGFAFISQNATSSNFTDTLGYIIKVDIANRAVVDTISIPGYTKEFGELILNPNLTGFFALNSGSNTITSIDFATLTATNTTLTNDLRVSGQSHITLHEDTLFVRMDNGIGAINLTNLSIIATDIIDTVVTAFTYDTYNEQFYVTQTDFFSFNLGKIYDRNGIKIDTLTVGYSPEVIRMYYDQTVGLSDKVVADQSSFSLYPNPAVDLVDIHFEGTMFSRLRILDENGKIVMEENLYQNRNRLQLGHLPKGMYFIEISNKVNRIAKPIILR